MPRVLTNRQLTRSIKKMQRDVELKYYDFTAADQDVTGAATFAGLTPFLIHVTSGLATGTGTSQRVGRQITITSLHLKALFKGNSAAALAPDDWNIIRLIIVKSNDLIATMDQILIPPNNANVTYNDEETNLLAFYDFYKKPDYKILYDETFDITALATPTDGAWNPGKFLKMIDVKIPLHYELSYISGSNVPENGHLTVIAYSTSTAVSHPVITYTCRLFYTDS